MEIFLKNQFVFYQKNSEAQIHNFYKFFKEQVLDNYQAIKKKKNLQVKKQQSIVVNQSSWKIPVWVGSWLYYSPEISERTSVGVNWGENRGADFQEVDFQLYWD